MEASYKSKQTDVRFRLFLLELLDGRELTRADIDRAIARDYPSKDFSRQRLTDIMTKLKSNHLISRTAIEGGPEEGCLYSYTATKWGRKKIDYYRSLIRDGLA